MSLANKESKIQIPDRMRDKLKQFQKRVWFIKLAEGLLAAAFGLLVSYLLVFVLDRFFDTTALVRTVILIVGALGLGIWFPLVCHKWIWKSRRLEQVAKLLKYKFPRLGDHLLGIIELVNNHEESSRSEALTRAALAQVDEETKNRDFSNAVPKPSHVRWALIAGIPAVIAAAALLVVPAAGGNAFVRWLMPWKHTERYTFAQIEELPNSIVVPIAENSSLRAKLADGTRWTPDVGSARVGNIWFTADHENGQYGFAIPPLEAEGDIKVSIGDIRESVTVQPKRRPELESLIANIKLPDYLERTELIRKDIRGGVVSTVAGSEVSFIATASREIKEATVDGQPIKVIGQEMLTSAMPVEDSIVKEFQWIDNYELTAKRPMQLKIRAKTDEAPSLYCPTLENKQVVMEKDVLTFEVNASDDFGVKTVGMQWLGTVAREESYEPATGEKIVSAGDPERTELNATATFSPKRLGIKPQVINLRLYAQDYLPDREPIYSSVYTVYVLSEADHAIWISRRIDDWYKSSLETYEQEVLNFESNQQLRELTAEELDRPENRNRIQAQVNAEQANARRLNALTELGTQLAQEASRNDEFSAETVTELAEMVEKLDNIASERMPSVADLLKAAADAPAAGPQNGQPQNGQPQNGQPQNGQPQNGQPQNGQPQNGQPQNGQPQNGQPQNGQPQPQEGEPQNGGQPSEGQPSGPATPPAPNVTDDKSGQSSGGAAPSGESEGEEEGQEPPPASPSITIKESTMDKPPETENEGEGQEGGPPPPPPGGAPLTLPGVSLQDNSDPGEAEEQPPADPSSAAEGVERAIEAQEQLLVDFQSVAEEMRKIVQNLEGSTFVKRFKAMARRHLELAQDINDMTLNEFGYTEATLKKTTVERSKLLSEREEFHGKTTSDIQEDLEAFFNRVNDPLFDKVLQQMKADDIVGQLDEVSTKILTNESGGSIAHAELLADTFDRWAEELVPLPDEQDGEEEEEEEEEEEGEPEEAPFLPPEIILEVMKILANEISLRDETRSLEQAKPQMEPKKFTDEGFDLSDTQQEIYDRTLAVIEEIKAIEGGEQAFSNELQNLTGASEAMNDALDELALPNTGPATIAAETEAIELLLQANRTPPPPPNAPPSPPSSGGTNPMDGQRNGVAQSLSLLRLFGEAEEEDTVVVERAVEQATGKTSEEVSEEFRYGMEKYFEALEKSR